MRLSVRVRKSFARQLADSEDMTGDVNGDNHDKRHIVDRDRSVYEGVISTRPVDTS